MRLSSEAKHLLAVPSSTLDCTLLQVSTALINVTFSLEPGQDPATSLSQNVCSLLKVRHF